MRALRLALALLLLLPALAQAHWTVDPTAPEWCRRGDLHWALHYGKVTRSDVDLMVAARQNLNHGAAYESPETAAYAASKGIRDLVYVCSRTFVVKDYEKHPELKHAVVCAYDGSEVLAYGNPVRRYGCVNGPEWKAFVIGKVEAVRAKRQPAGIFFDNEAWFVNCYCPVCKAKFREYSRRHYGRQMELPERVDPSTPEGRAARLFLLESQAAFHKALLEYCHGCKPPLLSVPNTCGMGAWPMHGIEDGVTDLPFYEMASHPPFGDSLYAYKLALAAGHGRNVGNLMYLPDAVGTARGARVWNEGMHSFFHPSSPLAKEIALAAAEGAACDATYVANYHLFPSLPITDVKDPFNARIHQVMSGTYDFLAKHRTLYLNADQGADLAILHSVPTDLWTGASRRWAQMAERLNRAGIPYEVIVERDLKPEILRRYRGILVSGVRALDEPGAGALAAYVRAGGRVLLAGECGLTDARGEPSPSQALANLRRGARVVQVDVLRDLSLEGFQPEGGFPRLWVKPGTKEGRATFTFGGENGAYKAGVTVQDEGDGASTLLLLVNGKQVASWALDEDRERLRTLTAQVVLRRGDRVTLVGKQDGGEMCRVESLVFCGARAEEGFPVGKGRVISLSESLDGADGARLRARVERLLDGPGISVSNPTGKLSVNVLSQPALKLREVHLLNYDFEYEAPANRVADDDGSSEARSYLANTAWRIRKVLRVPDPAAFGQAVLEIGGTVASSKNLIRVIVSLNGTDVTTLAPDQLRGTLSIPVPAGRLVAGENEVVVRVAGDASTQSEWYQVGIDEGAPGGRSSFSRDGGTTWSSEDLSEDRQAQKGEFLIRVVDPEKRPTYVEWEQMCHVRPARGIRVFVPGAGGPHALVLSPGAEPRRIQGRRVAGGTEFAVDVDLYALLVLADDEARLRGL